MNEISCFLKANELPFKQSFLHCDILINFYKGRLIIQSPFLFPAKCEVFLKSFNMRIYGHFGIRMANSAFWCQNFERKYCFSWRKILFTSLSKRFLYFKKVVFLVEKQILSFLLLFCLVLYQRKGFCLILINENNKVYEKW